MSPRPASETFPLWLGALLGVAACGAPSDSFDDQEFGLAQLSESFVNGSDDRQEYFHLSQAAQRAALERFTVALMPQSTAEVVLSGDMASLPTWGELDELCPDEPFGDQPSAAFCSGVLVDWDLILTSGHCIAAIPLPELRVVFGYYYATPGELAVSRSDVFTVESVIESRRDPGSGGGERLDFAWLRLTRNVTPPHEPARVHTRGDATIIGASVISIGAGGGVPFKLDAGGKVQNTRPDFDDYFVADTDTSEGSSGGGIFDENLAVLGTLARGAPDFQLSDGCWTTARQADPAQALEEFTYAHRAVEALCEVQPDRYLCDEACEQPCTAEGLPLVIYDEDGCSLRPGSGYSSRLTPSGWAVLSTSLCALLGRRRRRVNTR